MLWSDKVKNIKLVLKIKYFFFVKMNRIFYMYLHVSGGKKLKFNYRVFFLFFWPNEVSIERARGSQFCLIAILKWTSTLSPEFFICCMFLLIAHCPAANWFSYFAAPIADIHQVPPFSNYFHFSYWISAGQKSISFLLDMKIGN